MVTTNITGRGVVYRRCSKGAATQPGFRILVRGLEPNSRLMYYGLSHFTEGIRSNLQAIHRLSSENVIIGVLGVNQVSGSTIKGLALAVVLTFTRFRQSVVLRQATTKGTMTGAGTNCQRNQPPCGGTIVSGTVRLLGARACGRIIRVANVDQTALTHCGRGCRLQIATMAPYPGRVLGIVFSGKRAH